MCGAYLRIIAFARIKIMIELLNPGFIQTPGLLFSDNTHSTADRYLNLFFNTAHSIRDKIYFAIGRPACADRDTIAQAVSSFCLLCSLQQLLEADQRIAFNLGRGYF